MRKRGVRPASRSEQAKKKGASAAADADVARLVAQRKFSSDMDVQLTATRSVLRDVQREIDEKRATIEAEKGKLSKACANMGDDEVKAVQGELSTQEPNISQAML